MISAKAEAAKDRSTRRALMAVAAFALIVRGGILLATPDALSGDPDAYRSLAENLVEFGTFGRGEVPSAYRPPLYPLVLAPAVALGDRASLAIGAIHLILGVTTVVLVYLLGLRWGLGKLAAAAAVLVVCDPILLTQSTLVMTETLATLMAVVALWLLAVAAERPMVFRVAAAGGWIALAALCRPTFLVFAAVAVIVLAAGQRTWPGRLKTLAAFSVAVAVVLSPWVIRNQIQFGKPIFATTHGGYTLLLGNNPSFYKYLRQGEWGEIWNPDIFFADWSAQLWHGAPRDELSADRLAYARARQTIGGQPGMFVYAGLIRVGRLWSPLPHQLDTAESNARRMLRYAVAGWYIVVFVLAAVGLVAASRAKAAKERKNRGMGDEASPQQASFPPVPRSMSPSLPFLWGVLLCLAFTAVHAFYWTNMRMRAPLMPVVALATAGGVAWLAGRWKRRKP